MLKKYFFVHCLLFIGITSFCQGNLESIFGFVRLEDGTLLEGIKVVPLTTNTVAQYTDGSGKFMFQGNFSLGQVYYFEIENDNYEAISNTSGSPSNEGSIGTFVVRKVGRTDLNEPKNSTKKRGSSRTEIEPSREKVITSHNIINGSKIFFDYEYLSNDKRKDAHLVILTNYTNNRKTLLVSLIPFWKPMKSDVPKRNRLLVKRSNVKLVSGSNMLVRQAKAVSISTKSVNLEFNMDQKNIADKGEIHIPVEWVSSSRPYNSRMETDQIHIIKISYEIR